jgi:hypothetical protein
VRQAVLETLPCRGSYGYVISVVNAPVSAGKDLLRLVGIHNDGVHGDVRKIAGLVRPGKRATIRGACYLKDMSRCCRRVSVKPANSCVPNRQRCRCHGWIEGNSQHRTIGQDRVIVGNIHPVRLAPSARTEIETDPHVAVVRANNRDTLIFR